MLLIKKCLWILLISIVWINYSHSAEEVTGWALSETPVVVRGGTLIDVRNGGQIRDAVIVIRGDRIESVGTGRVSTPSGAITLDASGKYIIPGLIDAHIHYKDWSGQMYLNNGVTTVMSLGDDVEWMKGQKEGIKRGQIIGPRLYYSTDSVHGTPSDEMSDAHKLDSWYWDHHRYFGDDVEEVQDAMQEYITGDGVNAVKIQDDLSEAQLYAIMEEANKANIPVVGHWKDVYIAAKMGGAGIEHTTPVSRAILDEQAMKDAMGRVRKGLRYQLDSFMDVDRIPEIVQFMVDNNLYLNPTLRGYDGAPGLRERDMQYIDYDVTFNDWSLRFVPIEWRLANLKEYQEIGLWNWRDLTEYEINLHQQGFLNVLQLVKAFSDAGGKIYAGTDSANMATPGYSLHQEMELLVAAGLSPVKALQAATIHPAEMMRMEERLGAVEVGKTGDLVILDANPLEDIRNSRQIWRIVSRGKIFDGKYDAGYENPIPELTPLGSAHFFPSPRLRVLTPRKLDKDSAEATITLQGTGFIPYSFVKWNGRKLETEFVSEYELKAIVPAELLDKIGTYIITVENPDFGYGSSEARGGEDIVHLGWMKSMRDQISNELRVMVSW